MSKQLINLVGVLISVALLALAILLIAVPLATQALATNAAADQVDRTNLLYQGQIDALTKAKANKSETDASVEALRAQIPATPVLDQVFDLVTQSAQSAGATISSVAAGAPAAFAARTDATASGTPAAPSPAPSPAPTPSAAAEGQTNTATGTSASSGAGAGMTRTQISVTITATAADMNQMTAFLDALRAGPRLLSNITSSISGGTNGTGVQASISALTFVDGTPVATGASK